MKVLLKLKYLLIAPLFLLFSSCGLYKFSGASIPPQMKTVSIQLFENNAPLVVPYLSSQFTEALRNRIRTQTRLSVVRTDGDGNFEGRITDYSIRPVAVEATETPRAGANRLSITVSVKYTSTLQPKDSFEQSFTRYRDFNGQIQGQEQNLINQINTDLTEDIFNRAFANW